MKCPSMRVFLAVVVSVAVLAAPALAQQRIVYPQAVVGPSFDIELRLGNLGAERTSGTIRLLRQSDLQPMGELVFSNTAGNKIPVTDGEHAFSLFGRSSDSYRPLLFRISSETQQVGVMVIEFDAPAGDVVPSFYYRVKDANGVVNDLIAIAPATAANLSFETMMGSTDSFDVGLALVPEAGLVPMDQLSAGAPQSATEVVLTAVFADGQTRSGSTLLNNEQQAFFPRQVVEDFPDDVPVAQLQISASQPVFCAVLGVGAPPDFASVQIGPAPAISSAAGPEILAVLPGQVGGAGGDPVQVLGQGFTGASRSLEDATLGVVVSVGGMTIEDAQIQGPELLSFETPPLPNGIHRLKAKNLAGEAEGSLVVYAIPSADLPAGSITTVAGATVASRGFLGDGEQATFASFGESGPGTALSPVSAVVAVSGDVYLSDSHHFRVRKVDGQTGIISTIAGNGEEGEILSQPGEPLMLSGDGGLAAEAALGRPGELALDSQGNLFLIEQFRTLGLVHCVRRIAADSGVISSLVCQSLGTFALLGLAVSGEDEVLISLFSTSLASNQVVRLDPTSGANLGKLAGGGSTLGDGGPATEASLAAPTGMAVDQDGNVFIIESGLLRPNLAVFGANRIRRIDAMTGIITTVAGNGQCGSSGDGGLATDARINPHAVTVDLDGNVYLAAPGFESCLDAITHRIRRVDASTGVITTIAGSEESGFSGDGGPADQALLSYPRALRFDLAGNLLIVDSGNGRLRAIKGPLP